MRRKLAMWFWEATISVALLAVAGLPAFSAAAARHQPAVVRIVVTPATSSPKTRFTVRFRAPQRTGRYGPSERRYELRAASRAQSGCASSVSVQAPRSPKNARISLSLSPPGPGGHWCTGVYHGEIEEIQIMACHKLEGCPGYALVLSQVGRFSFYVRQSTGANDATPPSFAGLERAFSCTPGPQRPGQTTPYTLSWSPAADNATPSSQIVYDVFMSSIAGAEDFSRPIWTTAPGPTTFRTPGLASHGTFYFVVRARDKAGNEDQNRVERRGIDPCY